jgi:hypothetical protein
MVVTVSLRLLYSFLFSVHINPIQVHSFPTPLTHEPPLVWPVFHNIAASVLGLYATNEGEHAAFGFLSLANST